MDNNTSNTVLALATSILVIVTAFYAWQTRRLVKEMERGRRLSLLPILTCDIYRATLAGEAFMVRVRNTGNAPAITTKIRLASSNASETQVLYEWTINTLGLEQAEFLRILPLEGRLTATLICLNIYKQPMRTVATFDYELTGEQGNQVPGWKKINEEINWSE